jgi:hypothetical protein
MVVREMRVFSATLLRKYCRFKVGLGKGADHFTRFVPSW